MREVRFRTRHHAWRRLKLGEAFAQVDFTVEHELSAGDNPLAWLKSGNNFRLSVRADPGLHATPGKPAIAKRDYDVRATAVA